MTAMSIVNTTRITEDRRPPPAAAARSPAPLPSPPLPTPRIIHCLLSAHLAVGLDGLKLGLQRLARLHVRPHVLRDVRVQVLLPAGRAFREWWSWWWGMVTIMMMQRRRVRVCAWCFHGAWVKVGVSACQWVVRLSLTGAARRGRSTASRRPTSTAPSACLQQPIQTTQTTTHRKTQDDASSRRGEVGVAHARRSRVVAPAAETAKERRRYDDDDEHHDDHHWHSLALSL